MGRRGERLSAWVTRPDGGYASVHSDELAVLLRPRASKSREHDWRTWCAAREALEQRRAHLADLGKRGEPVPDGYAPSFAAEELRKLTGSSLRSLRRSLADLEHGGVMRLEESNIQFARPKRVGEQPPRLVRALRQLGPNGLYVPFPRRLLCWLARSGKSRHFAATVAVLLCACRIRDGQCSLSGSGSLTELADLLDVSLRALRSGVRELEELGWVKTTHIEGGLRFVVSPTWDAQAGEQQDEAAPPQNEARPSLRLVVDSKPGTAIEQRPDFAGSACQTTARAGEQRPGFAGCPPQTEPGFAGCTTYKNTPTEQPEHSACARKAEHPAPPVLVFENRKEKDATEQQGALKLRAGGRASEPRTTKGTSQPSHISAETSPATQDSTPPGRAERSEPKIPDRERLPEPTLRNLRPEDLEPLRAPRRDALYAEGVTLGWWPEGEYYRREVECMAEHARRVGDDPVRLFASLLRARETGRKQALAAGLTEGTPEFAAVVEQAAIVRGHRNPTDADDDAAGANLKAYARWQQAARGEERPWWMAHLVGEASGQAKPHDERSKDAQIAGKILAARSCGRTVASDAQVVRELLRHDSSWNLERWQTACAEHREWKREQRPSRELESSRRPPERILPFVIDCNAGWEAVFSVEVEQVSEEQVEPQRVPDVLPLAVNA